MSVAFQGTEQAVLTFEAGTVTAGYPVAICANDQVANADNGVAPAGIALHVRQGCAAVQVRGFMELPYSGTKPALGWQTIVADGTGQVRTATTEENGLRCLIVHVDAVSKTAGLYL